MRPFAWPQENPLSCSQEPLSQIHTPTLMESRMGEEDGEGINWERHMFWAASEYEMSPGSHMKDSSGDVLSDDKSY